MKGLPIPVPADGWEALLLIGMLACALATFAIFAAITVNFFNTRQSGRVARAKKSPVATFSMTLFFVGFYLLIRLRVGELSSLTRPVRGTLALAGTVLVLGGCAVNLLGRARLGANWADQVTIYESQTLVTEGVFGWVRHPLYASLVWMFAGAALVFANGAAFLANLLIFLPALIYRARQEEAFLAERFPEYGIYRRRVGMLVPRLFPRRSNG